MGSEKRTRDIAIIVDGRIMGFMSTRPELLEHFKNEGGLEITPNVMHHGGEVYVPTFTATLKEND